MGPELGFFLTAFVSLFALLDPIGGVPIFVFMTPANTPAERRSMARRAPSPSRAATPARRAGAATWGPTRRCWRPRPRIPGWRRLAGGRMAHPEEIPRFLAVLVGELLIVQVVHQTDDAPFLFILAFLAGTITHHRLDSQSVLNQAIVLIVFFKQRECLLAGWLSFGHILLPHTLRIFVCPPRRLAPGPVPGASPAHRWQG